MPATWRHNYAVLKLFHVKLPWNRQLGFSFEDGIKCCILDAWGLKRICSSAMACALQKDVYTKPIHKIGFWLRNLISLWIYITSMPGLNTWRKILPRKLSELCCKNVITVCFATTEILFYRKVRLFQPNFHVVTGKCNHGIKHIGQLTALYLLLWPKLYLGLSVPIIALALTTCVAAQF